MTLSHRRVELFLQRIQVTTSMIEMFLRQRPRLHGMVVSALSNIEPADQIADRVVMRFFVFVLRHRALSIHHLDEKASRASSVQAQAASAPANILFRPAIASNVAASLARV